MSVLEASLGYATAFCVGTAAVVFGAPPSGTMEATIGAAGLVDFVLGRDQKFGHECRRVRGRIQSEILKNYQHLTAGSDGGDDARAELEAADEALREALGRCVVDRTVFAESAVTPAGFPARAVIMIMTTLGEQRPDLFGPEQKGALAYRFAHDVIHAGIKATFEDTNFYRKLEPVLMFEMATAIGSIRDATKRIEAMLAKLTSETSVVIDAQESKKLMENFVENLAYELRAPITCVIGFLSLAEREDITDEQRKKYYSSAYKAGCDVLFVVDKTLAMVESDTSNNKSLDIEDGIPNSRPS
ncbi:MAG: hypothetical protein ROR55_06410 [Devosia sp.]